LIILIDNYDSFVYNLVQYLGSLERQPVVFRNDQAQVDELVSLSPEAVIISPGPCTPLEAGISNDVIRAFAGKVPVLGVCLGHQCIGYVFGGRIIRAKRLMHGKVSTIHHDGKTIFQTLPNPFVAVRYHSLAIERESLPDCLEITAESEDGEIMGVRHKTAKVEGVQFHPESFMTDVGMVLLRNFLKL
jgi:anthranilate synthase/aminodeoxychorismate synthase-like glutamine amidotransferase